MGPTTAPTGSMWQPEFSSEHASVTNAEATDAHTGIVTSQATNPFGNVSFQAQGEFQSQITFLPTLVTSNYD
ncbi:unnamed protein product [Haemonchus placei]|uniref:Carboxypeptidase regulatory-like domain-containing protein n=1 Tax=Haemonchus placei TaxID=6290 RepID=A0A0N4VVK9_HAEPC|nr:unnamed protein product [Haemonchus placei]